MTAAAPALAWAGFAIVTAAMVQYFLTVNREKVPVGVVPHAIAWSLGIALSVAAIVLMPVALHIVLGVFSLMLGGLLLFLLAVRKTPPGALIAAVGQPMPPLRDALDEHGQPWELDALAGQRVLFKFFRGSW